MSTSSPQNTASFRTPASIRRLLQTLRQRIRWYVVVEGIAMTVIWLVVAFWCMLAMDYLPVLLGASEMPRQPRIVMLGIVGVGCLFVVYWYVIRRIFFVFRDSSLAILIERQFPEFRDSLVTTVQLGEAATKAESADHQAILAALSDADQQQAQHMLRETVTQAETGASSVRVGKVFDFAPLLTKILWALLAIASIVILGFFGGNILPVGASRLLGLSERPWPRRARIEMVGFVGNERKIARGTDTSIHVRADATRPFPPPDLCSILYETEDGERGRVNMSRDGEPRDGYQYYVFTGKPFKSVLNDIQFDVIGYDHRLRDQRLKAVPSPVVSAIRLVSEPPAYLGQTVREEQWNPGLQLPRGSSVQALVQSSKPLLSATTKDLDSGEVQDIKFAEPTKEWTLEFGKLMGRKAISISLYDVDQIDSLEPLVLSIGAIEDEPPEVDVLLRGIGSAITVDARLPFEGTIRDDYEIARTWFELQRGESKREFDFVLPTDKSQGIALDLREQAAAAKETPLQLQEQDRLILSVKANDQYDLDGESHIGSSESVTLTVVRPDELLAILDGRELGLRRRLDQIRGEMGQSRDQLGRLRGSFRDARDDEETANLQELRDRWASWASQKGDQSSLEIEGLALAFEDIREELINNRLDTQPRKSRLEIEIIAPLRKIAGDMFPAWQRTLGLLRSELPRDQKAAEPLAVQAVNEADQILVSIDDVLSKMLELEDYAELVKILRQLIEQQESLIGTAKEEQKSKVLDFLQ